MTANRWPDTGPLPADPLVFLEASAGTGKTYAMEGIVAQLVAEHDIAIHQILVITFTKAATADLRRRVRTRLLALHDAVTGSAQPTREPIALRWAGHADPTLLAARLARALADFDRAPISTIHGFCQRTLQELAFESGQEPALEVIGDPGEVRELVVADHLAHVFAQASVADLRLLQDMGWQPAALRKLAKAMTGPTEPALRPEVEPGLTSPLAVVGLWRQVLGEFEQWLGGPHGQAALAAWQAEAERPTKTAAKGRPPFRRMSKVPGNLASEFADWLACEGLTEARPMAGNVNWLDLDRLAREWNPIEGPVQDFAGYALAIQFAGICQAQDELWRQPLVRFARDVRGAFEAEIERRAQLTYDAMLSRLADRLDADAAAGRTALADAMRARYRVALVDEFQDTDGAQWRVLKHVFGRPEARLFVVGDPKQSIYRFRGADLAVYVQARAGHTPWALDTNRRTDEPLVEALNTLWRHDPTLNLGTAGDGDPVRYVRVRAHEEVRVRDLPAQVGPDGERKRRPLELRWFHPGTCGRAMDERLVVAEARNACARLCAAEVIELLGSPTQLLPKGQDEWRPIQPGDVAVLCRTNQQAADVRDLLRGLGVPAVVNMLQSIFRSEAALWLMAWCDAVAAPEDERPARTLAVTPLVGWTADQLTNALGAGNGPLQLALRADWEALRRHLAGCAKTYVSGGFARALDQTLASYETVARLVGSAHGERAATDLRHLSELCHSHERERRCGPRALADWLRREVAEPDDRNDDQTIRLESDAAAVQLVTLHSSKGLEYPIVLLPFSWEGVGVSDRGQGILLRDPPGSQRVVLDLSGPNTAARAEALAAERAAQMAEQLRLLYVAMTRARHHLVVWFGCPSGDGQTGLATLLLAHADEATRASYGVGPLAGADLKEPAKLAALAQHCPRLLQAWSDPADSGIGWSEVAQVPDLHRWRPPTAHGSAVAARPFDANLRPGAGWLATSFSALARGKDHDDDEPLRWLAEVVDQAEPPPAVDLEAAVEAPPLSALGDANWWLDAAPGANLPGGTRTGDWLHAVFEELSFGGAPGQAPVAKDGRPAAQLLRDHGAHSGISDSATLQTALDLLPRWLDTPLDGEAGGIGLPNGWCLRQLADADRLDELAFDFRLGAGASFLARHVAKDDARGRQVSAEGVRQALQLASEDRQFGGAAWVRAWLEQPGVDGEPKHLLPTVAGMLTGFVDLVFRTGGSGADAQYYVADYKTNAVRGPDPVRDAMAVRAAARYPNGAPRLLNYGYGRPLLQWAMGHAAYHLQSLLYTVALHRLLRARLGARYDYDRQVGGHLYLFLKGMGGVDTPTHAGARLGVWADRWPKSAVVALDRALDGGEAAQ